MVIFSLIPRFVSDYVNKTLRNSTFEQPAVAVSRTKKLVEKLSTKKAIISSDKICPELIVTLCAPKAPGFFWKWSQLGAAWFCCRHHSVHETETHRHQISTACLTEKNLSSPADLASLEKPVAVDTRISADDVQAVHEDLKDNFEKPASTFPLASNSDGSRHAKSNAEVKIHAINFVNKTRSRFQNEPNKYKEFLNIIHTYKAERDNVIKAGLPTSSSKSLNEHEVYSKVAKIFESHEDLLEEFERYMFPEDDKHAISTK